MFANGSYATIWQVKKIEEKYSEMRISTSSKDKTTGEYSQDFGAFVRFVGKAHQEAQHLGERDRFKIVRCGVTNEYNKEKQTTFTRYLIFEIETDTSADSQDKMQPSDENPFIS